MFPGFGVGPYLEWKAEMWGGRELCAMAMPHVVLTVPDWGWDLYDALQRMDLEGIVAKRKADPYDPRTSWFKLKNPRYSQGYWRCHGAPPRQVHRHDDEDGSRGGEREP